MQGDIVCFGACRDGLRVECKQLLGRQMVRKSLGVTEVYSRHLCQDLGLLWSPRGQFRSDKEEDAPAFESAWHAGPGGSQYSYYTGRGE
jgi:hypothetical protein